MLALSMISLYVSDPTISANFYAKLFKIDPTQSSPTFVMFKLPGGVGIGLWSRQSVVPVVTAPGGGNEMAFAVPDADGTYGDWIERGLTIAQAPADAGFGRNFVALDPDGHRLRIFTPAPR